MMTTIMVAVAEWLMADSSTSATTATPSSLLTSTSATPLLFFTISSVLSYISLKADERDVYEFFSRAGKYLWQLDSRHLYLRFLFPTKMLSQLDHYCGLLHLHFCCAYSALGRKDDVVMVWEQGYELAVYQSADLKQLLELESF
ncbi:hypothetical protein L1887_38090 [Cichorium endivia]|nr:hypothetical protein L1887_38090 [Cichorium endivia]